MTLNATLSAARHALAPELDSWEEPPRRALPADAFMCASVLRVAIRRGCVELAMSAASTLLFLDPQRLWRGLLAASVEDHGSRAFDLASRVLAAVSDPRWRKRQGTEWKTVSLLVDSLCTAAKCGVLRAAGRLAIHFYMSYPRDQQLIENTSVSVGVMDTTWILRALLQAYSGPLSADQKPTNRWDELERLSEHVPWAVLDLADALWRRTRSPAALALAAVHPLSECTGLLDQDRRRGDCPSTLLAAMTHETPTGRKAISAFIEADEAISAVLEETGLVGGDRIDAVGELLSRLEEHPGCADPECRKWESLSRYAGVTHFGLTHASTLSRILSDNRAPMADQRRLNLPTIRIDFDLS